MSRKRLISWGEVAVALGLLASVSLNVSHSESCIVWIDNTTSASFELALIASMDSDAPGAEKVSRQLQVGSHCAFFFKPGDWIEIRSIDARQTLAKYELPENANCEKHVRIELDLILNDDGEPEFVVK